MDLGFELATLRRAVEAVRLLTELGSMHLAPDEDTALAAPACAVAVADLVVERLRAVERAVRDDVDVAPLVARHNEAVGHADGAVHLMPWSSERRRRESQRELRRVRSETRTRRAPRRP
jgi:hypothetical protein